jgi:exodeoxyribonuclease VII small subunit
MAKKDQDTNLTESLAELSQIVKWFENENEVDVEAGLEKVREGAELIKICKARLAKIENEFKEIQKEIGREEGND